MAHPVTTVLNVGGDSGILKVYSDDHFHLPWEARKSGILLYWLRMLSWMCRVPAADAKQRGLYLYVWHLDAAINSIRCIAVNKSENTFKITEC